MPLERRQVAGEKLLLWHRWDVRRSWNQGGTSESEKCCIWQTLGRNRWLTLELVKEKKLSSIPSTIFKWVKNLMLEIIFLWKESPWYYQFHRKILCFAHKIYLSIFLFLQATFFLLVQSKYLQSVQITFIFPRLNCNLLTLTHVPQSLGPQKTELAPSNTAAHKTWCHP